MLRKKTSGVASGPLSSSFIGKAAETVVDRRAFLRGSGLAIGGLATAAALLLKYKMAFGLDKSLVGIAQSILVHIVPKVLPCGKPLAASVV